MRRDGHREDSGRRQSCDENGERIGERGQQRVAATEAHELRIRLPDASGCVFLAAVDDELGGATEELHELGGELATGLRLPLARGAGEHAGDHGNRDPPEQQSEREDPGSRRKNDGRGDDAGRPGEECDERRPDSAEVEALQGVDVSDHPGEEVAPPVALQLGRREWLDACVEARADPAERPQGEVVRGEALEVAGDGPGQAEEADGHDRHGQREDRGVLRGARDEVARRRHERDPEADGERPERDGEADSPGWHAGEREESAKRDHAALASASSTIRPATSPTVLSASRTSSGLWAMRSTVRPSASLRIAAPTDSTLSGSRWAVGSSRITSGASRKNARAMAIRWRWPAERRRPPSPTTVA